MKKLTISTFAVAFALAALFAPLAARTPQKDPQAAGTTREDKKAPGGPALADVPLAGDLSIYSISINPTVTQGDSLHHVASVQMQYTGTQVIDDFSFPGYEVVVRLYLSEDANIVPGEDPFFGTRNIPKPIVPGDIIDVDLSSWMISYFGPSGPGLYFGAFVDWADAFGETDETNNTAVAPVEVIEAPRTSVYYEDFQEGPGGWVGKDFTTNDPHMNLVTYFDGAANRGVWWCGELDPGYSGGTGYGNRWDQRLTKQFTIPAGLGSYDMTYKIQYDVEPGYDYVDVEVSTNGGATFTSLRNDGVTDWDGDGIPDDARHNGTSQFNLPNLSDFEDHAIDLSAYAGQTVHLRFRFTSDGGWSDEDGRYVSNGAYRLDQVQVPGSPVDDFEADGGGWIPSVAPPVGGNYRLVYDPHCPDQNGCGFYTDGTTPVTLCNTWVGYDPVTLRFPETPVYATRAVSIGIESAPIPVPTDAGALYLSFDYFTDLPLSQELFYTWEVSANGSTWSKAPFVYYNESGAAWFRARYDLLGMGIIAPGTSSIRVRIIGTDLSNQYDFGHEPNSVGPMFDNIEIVAINTASPGIDASVFPRPCGASPSDLDGDGILDVVDACPSENAANFDRNGDGCVDAVASGRHVEYWAQADMPLAYYIHEAGAPGIGDGSDFAAINSAMAAWTQIDNAEVSVQYLGTTSQAVANAMDGVNTITFSDGTFQFPAGVLAVGITTSFDVPTNHMGTDYRPGQIWDSDMIFNPAEDFRTTTQGTGSDIEATATHEAGHLFGLSHSAVRTSTMFFVLPPDTLARSLAREDRTALFNAYPDETVIPTTTRLQGTVTDGTSGLPLGGVIVYAISVATGDTAACTFTLPRRGIRPGTYDFVGLPEGDYYVAIHALDGSSEVGFIGTANINHVINQDPAPAVVAEYWDDTESNSEDPMLQTAVTLTAGLPVTADFETNVDTTPPSVVAVYPAPDTTDVPIDAAILVRFSESVDGLSLGGGNFSLRDAPTGTFVPGNAALIHDDSTLLYSPTANLAFSTTYNLDIVNVADVFGNRQTTPFSISFTTQTKPDVSITSLSPSKAVVDAVLVINGEGFEPNPGLNEVRFDGVPVPVTEATATQIVTTVPAFLAPGPAEVRVFNYATAGLSNPLTFTVLAPEQQARGVVVGEATLGGLPRSVAVSATGTHAFATTTTGVTAVDVRQGAGYLTATSIPIAGGTNGIAGTPDGRFMYVVSTANERLYRINADPGAGPIGVISATAMSAAPRGIVMSPGGRRAYISTDVSEIQIWDVNEASGTFESQVGTIVSSDPNIGGAMATDPGGDKLLVATIGTGRLLVFDLLTGEQMASIEVQPDPADVVVEPGGERAYVTDRFGYVSVVGLNSLTKIVDITTGGSLRGAAITSAGSYLYAADNYLNYLTVVDLVSGSPTYRSVKTRIAQPNNPVDVVFSPDGLYAYSGVEDGNRLIVTAIGVGPVLESLSATAGPVGAKLTLAGSGLSGGTSTTVSFNGVSATPDRETDGALTVAVPAGASSGPVSVVLSETGQPDQVSNAIYFDVLGPTTTGALRFAGGATPPGAAPLAATLAVTSDDAVVVVGGEIGFVHLLDNRASSPNFSQFVATVPVGVSTTVSDVVVTPDDNRAFATDGAGLHVIDINPTSPGFGTLTEPTLAGSFDRLLVSSDGRYLLAAVSGTSTVQVFDISAAPMTPVTSTSLADGTVGLDGAVGEMAMHPGGTVAYATILDATPTAVVTIDMDPASATLGARIGTGTFSAGGAGHVPVSLAFSPDGARCYVLTDSPAASDDRSITTLDCSTPASPADAGSQSVAAGTTPSAEHVRVSPRGDRLIVNTRDEGFAHFDLSSPPTISPLDILSDAIHADALDFVYSPGGDRLYAVSTASDRFYRLDFNAAQRLDVVSGNGQTGVIGTPLARPFRVRVTDIASSTGSAGVPVTFTVTGGGGHFVTAEPGATPTQVVVATDEFGFARASLVLGGLEGTNNNTVDVSALVDAGSPLLFSASAIIDPATLPLELTSLRPAEGATNVSVTSVVSATFSRPVFTPLDANGMYISADGGVTRVPVIVGFADGNRTISLTPQSSLAYGTTYQAFVTAFLTDTNEENLVNPATHTFTTQLLPPVTLNAISPNSAPEGADVVLSGQGFDPIASGNVVRFGAIEAIVTGATTNSISAVVPIGASTGSVTVEAFATSSGAIPFTVVDPSVEAGDEVIATAGTGTSPRGVSVAPDGAYIYSVAPDANLLIPVNLYTFTAEPGIPVGERPWALAVNPAGTSAYVANLWSGDVSVVDIDTASPDFHRVTDNINVGTAPNDVIVAPGGDAVIVANAGSEDISIIDSNTLSGSYHTVVATVGTGGAARGVAVAPDGTRIFVGTDTGYTVIDALNYAVTATVGTGSSTRGVAVGPDGTLLILLTSAGNILVYNVVPGSSRENQVVATVGTGTTARGVSVGPDGGRLYLLGEEGDVISEYSLDIGTSVAVLGPDHTGQVTDLEFIRHIFAGENPQALAFLPDGSGDFVVANAGDATITLLSAEAPLGSIAGFVSGSCAGSQGPLSDVVVNVTDAQTQTLVATATTDLAGAYQLNDLEVGDYNVSVELPTGYLSAASEASVTVIDGGVTSADFTLECAPGSIAGLVLADCPDPDSGVDGVTVHVYSTSGGDTPILSDTTDTSGAYRFDDLEVGDYNVEIILPASYASASAVSMASVTSLATTQVDFALECLGSIAGTVSADCPDPDSPVEGVGVVVFDPVSGDTAGTASSDASGFYQVSGLGVGDYDVLVTAPPGYADPTGAVSTTVVGLGIATVDFALECLGGLAGTVTADCPDPDAGVFGVGVSITHVASGLVVATTATDSAGVYETGDLPNGDYTVDISPPPGYVGSLSQTPVTVVGQLVTTADFALACVGNVTGRVAADCPEPDTDMFGVAVTLSNNGAAVATTTTDSSGVYGFVDVTPGDYQVSIVVPDGYLSSADTAAVTVVGLATTTADFPLNCESFVSGRVAADCPAPDTGLSGVDIDLYSVGTSAALVATATTDTSGAYHFDGLVAGNYMATILTPQGYVTDAEDVPLVVDAGQETTVDFDLVCTPVTGNVEKMSYWKRQLARALQGRSDDVDGATLCSYLDLISAHFNSHRMNPVVVYEPPASGLCEDKLQVAGDLLNIDGEVTMEAKARQQLLSLLFNVAGNRIHLSDVISEDAATVSKAITFVDDLLHDGTATTDTLAFKTAKTINQGRIVDAGVIPIDIRDIRYSPEKPRVFALSQNYPNPFNPETTIRYELAAPVHVTLRIYDVRGRLVRTLVDEPQPAERYAVRWDGRNNQGSQAATGVYFYRLEAGSFLKTKKMVMLK